MDFVTILLIIMTMVASISIVFAMCLSIDKRRLKREVERLNNIMRRDGNNRKSMVNRERDLNLEVFRLKKKLRRGNRI